jgi:hypothetical protein
MKTLCFITPVILFISCKSTIDAGDIKRENFCRYFTIQQSIDTGYSVVINNSSDDKAGAFINHHRSRFDYLANKVLMEDINLISPVDYKAEYCKYLMKDEFYYHFLLLTPVKRDEKKMTITFTRDEMMKVASRFFYVEPHNEKDTTLAAHICVGNNGLRKLRSIKDLTVLEAFCFESLFHYLNSKKYPFTKRFLSNIQKYAAAEKAAFTDYKSYLLKVRQCCYDAMERDAVLQTALLAYYQHNKNSISFLIE